MLSPEVKRNIFRILPFGLIWLIYSMVYSFMERGLLGTLDYYPSTGNPYHFTSTFLITALLATLVGLMIGTVEVLYLNKLLLTKSLLKKIAYKIMIYLAVIISFLLISSAAFNAFAMKTGLFSKAAWDNVWKFFFNYAFWSIEIYIASIIGFSLFYSEVSENLGQGVLTNFFTGRYHTPKQEERIFMFLDMKSSTTIAEEIGHIRYFEMLKSYFADLSGPIINYAGEIYQYVGDEIVVSWKLKEGVERNNCIECFYAMKNSIVNQTKNYQARFGLVPEFKAGLHYGMVTTGEIGVIKKDIIFTGDVLNTTARIQSLCNEYKVDILISDHLMEKLTLPPTYKVEVLGEAALRGRSEKIKLFSIRR